jgi:hypothetical protein
MTCTMCGSAVMWPAGICGTCGTAVVSPSTWEHPDGSGPVDVDATLEFAMPRLEDLDRAAAAAIPGHPAPAPPSAQFGAAEGYGIGPGGLPEGPMAGRSYAVPFPASEASAPPNGFFETPPAGNGYPETPTVAPSYAETFPAGNTGYPETPTTATGHAQTFPTGNNGYAETPRTGHGHPETPTTGNNGYADTPTTGHGHAETPAAGDHHAQSPSAGHRFGSAGIPPAPFGEPQAAPFNAVEAHAAQFGMVGSQDAPVNPPYHGQPGSSAAWAQAAEKWGVATPGGAGAAAPGDPPRLYGEPAPVPDRFSLVALVLAGLAVVLVPAGLAALFFASMARNRTESLGPMSFTVAAGASVVGCLVDAIGLVALL